MNILYEESPSMFKNNPLGFILSIILIPVFGLGIIILLYWYIQCKATKLTIDETDINYEFGLLSKEHSEINIESVRTVKVKQSFFNRIFGVGSIELYTAGDNPEIVVKGIPDPHTVRTIIKEQQSKED